MYRISKQISFCYGHRLLEHAGKCRHLHGHNARAVITLEAPELDGQGMVRDFGEVGDALKAWVEREIDHTMLLHPDDPVLPVLQEAGERVFTMKRNPTAESIARMLFEVAREAGFPVVEVVLWETDTACATYRMGSE
jgi:6-pyruvoyltetrahydropterin/6-carboxytetrahydropterin synthase